MQPRNIFIQLIEKIFDLKCFAACVCVSIREPQILTAHKY